MNGLSRASSVAHGPRVVPRCAQVSRVSLGLQARRNGVKARVSSIPSRPAADDERADAHADAAPAPPSAMQLQEARIVQLQLNVAHYTVDGSALPMDHPDKEEPRASLLIPADHPEAPQIAQPPQEDQQPQQQLAQRSSDEQLQHEQPAIQAFQTDKQQQQHRRQQHRNHQPQQQQQQQQPDRQQRRPEDLPLWQRHPRCGERIQPNFNVGDLVLGEVIHNAGNGGARVRLLEHEGVIGFMPSSNEPLTVLDSTEIGHFRTPRSAQKDHLGLPVGHIRTFKVRNIPPSIYFHGKGPVLSAAEADHDMMWHRAQQVFDLCKEHPSSVTIKVVDYNSGGLVASFLGLQAFVPFSGVDKAPGQFCDAAAMVGKQLNVAMIDCDKGRRALTMSEKVASTYKVLRELKPGSLVLGTVKRVDSTFAQIKLDGVKTHFTARLHASKFSCSYTRWLDRYLRPDERIMALVVDVAPNLSRVELSTAHLEVNPGDMHTNRKSVFATADRQAAIVRQQMAEAEAAAGAEAAAAAAQAAAADGAHEQAWCEPVPVPAEAY